MLHRDWGFSVVLTKVIDALKSRCSAVKACDTVELCFVAGWLRIKVRYVVEPSSYMLSDG